MDGLLLQAIINGVLLGAIYVIASSGLSLVFGVMHVVNAAQGDFVILGAFVAYWINYFTGVDPYILCPLVAVIFFVVGYLLHIGSVFRMIGRPALMSLILFFGLSTLLSNIALLIWSPYGRIVTTPLSGANLTIGPIAIPTQRLVSFIISLLFVYCIVFFLQKTKTGLAVRAASGNLGDVEAAMLVGVDINKIYAFTLGLGTAAAGAAGALISPIFTFTPVSGSIYTLLAFAITVLGGLGYLHGTIIGGLLIGIVQSLIVTFYDVHYVYFVIFLLIYLVLVFRPKGLFGKGA